MLRRVNYRLEAKNCLDGMQELAAESVDAVVTSPPYNLGVDYGTYKDDLPEDQYLRWSRQWLEEVFRVLKAKGSFFLNYGGAHAAPLLPFKMALLAAECGFQIQNTFHWIKSIAVPLDCGLVTLGQFRPVPSDRYVNDCHEFVFHLAKGGDTPLVRESIGVPYTDKSNLGRFGHQTDLLCRARRNRSRPATTGEALKRPGTAPPLRARRTGIVVKSLGKLPFLNRGPVFL